MGLDYAAILQYQTTSLILLDEDLRVVYLNEAAESLYTTSLKQGVGQPFYAVVSGDTDLVSACTSVRDKGVTLRLRQHELALPGIAARPVNCTVSRIDDNQDNRILVEISEGEVSRAIMRDEEFVQRQQSNQAVIRGLAHEIRNPLGGIRGAAQLLAEETGSQVFDEYTRIIIREADRLTALVDRMQAKTRANLDQSVNIHRLLEHVRQLVLAESNRALEITTDYDPSLPALRGNADLLIQALLNVIRNAADAVPDTGGQINLRSRIDHLSTDGRRTQVVRVDVIDNGSGIDPAIEQHIFDPMVTGKANGTGLGLPITAEIVARHEGALDVISAPGETRFRLFLPIARAELPGGEVHDSGVVQ